MSLPNKFALSTFGVKGNFVDIGIVKNREDALELVDWILETLEKAPSFIECCECAGSGDSRDRGSCEWCGGTGDALKRGDGAPEYEVDPLQFFGYQIKATSIVRPEEIIRVTNLN